MTYQAHLITSSMMKCSYFLLLVSSIAQWSCHLTIASKFVPAIRSKTANYQDNAAIPHYSSSRKKPLDRSKLKYIEIGGLFPMNGTTGWIGGQGCLPAAMMALEDVNNNEDLLPGYYLNLTWKNSQVRRFEK